MKPVVDSTQMKSIDSYTIDKIGIPGIVLMERAALSVAEIVVKETNLKDKILAVCGVGNNGADGVAAARLLYLEGYSIDILIVGDITHGSELMKKQINIAQNLGISIYNNIQVDEYTIIIDAIFGIGLNKPVLDPYKNLIEEINTEEHMVFSVDIPSGLSADTAKPMGVAIKADYTITFGYNKIGLILYPGCKYAGIVKVADIGFPQIANEAVPMNHFTYDHIDLDKLPIRKDYSNKGNYGKVLIIAGSYNMSGASLFSAKAAYRTGAGLVKILTVDKNRTILQSQLPEALLSTYEENAIDSQSSNQFIKEISWADVIVIGPGIGVSEASEHLLDLVLQHGQVPVLIDADGINILARKADKEHELGTSEYDRINYIISCLPEQVILTPHLRELAYLLREPVNEIVNNLLATADKCTYNNMITFVLKDAKTIVAYQNKRYINTSGNNGMATGGTGDVLTGIIAALIGQGMSVNEAATLGVYIHGLAGDKAREAKGCYALMASDVIDMLAKVL